MLKNRKSLPQDHKHWHPNQPLGCATENIVRRGDLIDFQCYFPAPFHCHRTKSATWSQIFTQSPRLLRVSD